MAKTPAGEKQKKIKDLPMGRGATADYVSTSTRQIDNGHVTTRTISDGKGYHSTETYSKDRPEINHPAPNDGSLVQAGNSSLRRAVDHLKKV